MATSPLPAVSPTSLDVAGISVVTAAPSSSDPRAGAAFNTTDLAAAAPVWFHPLASGSHVMISSRRWINASPTGGAGATFSSYTEDLTPSWTILNGSTGQHSAVPGASADVPMNTPVSTATVVAGASRPPMGLYLLHSTNAGAVLQRFHANPNGAVTLAVEEVAPTIAVGSDTVVFDKGMQYDSPQLVLYGTDSTGQVYRIRKPWAKVGVNKVTSIPTQQHATVVGNQVGWEYYTGTGYDTNPSAAGPVAGLNTVGPMSFGSYRNQTVMSTVVKSGTDYTGLFWISRSGRPAVVQSGGVSLGSTADGSYLGGGAQLQPQLGANPTATVLSVASVRAGIPYVVSKRTGTSGAYGLTNAWNILPLGL